MFKALMGGNRSSSDVASTSSSKSSRRRKDSKSTVSRKSSRGDDRDRGLGDLSAYPTSGSRKLRGEGDSVASTTDPDALLESDRFAIEQAAKRKSGDARRDRDRDGDRDSKSARRRDRDRTTRDSGRRSRTLDDLDGEFGREHDSNRKERRRTQSGDPYPPPLDTNLPTSGPGGHFAAEIAAPGFSQFPMQYDAMVPGSTVPEQGASPAGFDPHVHQQFPGQFPSAVAEPYRPPNPAGEAADYYGDQGQSVAEQPGVRPNPPSVLPNNQAHLMPASPVVNPPPEPSSMGQVGAAASYFTDDVDHQASYPTSDQQGRPPKPHMQSQSTSALSSAAAGTATYGVGSAIGDHADSPSYSTGAVGSSNIPYAQPAQTNPNKPPHSHSIGSAVGAAATGAAAGYVMGHHHHPSSSPEQLPQYTMQNYDYPSYGVTATPGYNENPALAAGAAGLAGYGAHEMYSHGGSSSQGPPFQSGGLAFQQRQRGPLGRFVDFWRDPEGVGMFEDYTETIGVCRYCFEPGTTSRDAPRHHHYHRRRRSWDRRSSGSRVEKLSRFTSSEEESRRRRKSKKKSWLPGLLAGYAAKSLFSNKGFDDSYSVKSGRVVSPRQSWDGGESASTADRKSPTSRGVYRRSNRSGSYDRYDSRPYIDQKSSRYADPRVHSRSRSRSSSRSGRHSALRDAALGAAVGSAALGMSKSYRRSRSPRKSKSRKESSSSDSSYSDISRPARKSVAGGLASFFTTPSENRKKRPSQKRRGIFSFNNSSSSSLDADLAFGSGYTRKGSRKSKGRADRDRDIDAKLLGLGATAAALAGSSPRNHRRPGEILAAKNSRSRHSDYTPSATNDDGWEDLDSGDQSASSVSSALAFGGDDSQTSDSGTSKWGWRWGGKKDKKKRESISPEEYHTGAALGAGALGGAALASAYRSHSKPPSQDVSSTGSLQPVFPVPTSDPSQFDAARVPSATQPALVRPGPIPLQQPQPVTPVSHAVYTTQGEPAYYTAISEPPAVGNIYPAYTSQYQDQSAGYRGQSDCGYRKSHWRSGSFPVPGTEPFEDVQTTPSLKRRSTTKDQATVQFDLTEEQARKERRANRLEKERRDIRYDEGPQLIDREHQLELEDVDRQTKRRDDREDDLRRRKDYDDTSSRLSRRRIDLEDWERQTDVGKERDSSSWIGAAATGAIGAAAAAATVLSGKSSHEGSSEANQGRYSERREKRRAERRRADLQAESATCETAHDVSNDIPAVDRSDEGARQSEFYGASQYKPHDDYAQFFAPKGLRDSPDYDSWEQSRPRILEREPANERFSREMSQVSGSSYRNDGALSWPIPTLNLIEPTPPQSVNGSTRGAASPTSASVEMSYEDTTKAEKQKSGSRVSWGEHETHEYEAQSTSAKRNAYQPGVDTRPLDNDRSNETSAKAAPEQAPGSYGEDIEFAATVAAATAAAGFDPSLVTDDPTYHKRTSPHGPDLPRGEPHGFVEGEVETSDSEEQGKQPVNLDHVDKLRSAESGAEHFIEGAPIYSEPENFAGKGDASTATNERPLPSDNEAIKPSVEKEDSDNEQHFSSPKEFSMPGGFEPDDSPRESRDRDYLENRKDDSRSVFSAPVAGESETLRSKKTTRSKDSVDELPDNVPESAGAEGMEERKKRRKRRSKRDSGNFDDSASITSSPAKIEAASEKPRSKDGKEKEKGSGGFFSNIFGSRVSEPAEPRRASSIDGRDREVKSEIGTGEREESKRRKKRSSRHRSSDSVDVLDDPRQFEYEGSDRESNRPGEQDDVNIENYKSHRQRREERRRHRYEDIVGSGKGTEYEKDRKDDDNADRQSFLARSPEIPEKVDDREGGASGLASATEATAAGLGLAMMAEGHQRRSVSPKPQSRPTSPEVSPGQQAEGRRSRRPSMLPMSDSPTAVPLHFRRPPVPPGVNRPPSASSPAAPPPESPTQPRHRRPASTEFKNSREFRPLWLVERHGSAKNEPQPDEPLPSLPSSKTSSRSPSIEDLKGSGYDQDVRSWEAVDLSQHIHEGRRSPGLRISTGRDNHAEAEHDILGSQQATPTAETFGEATQPVNKEKPKYEFHSPSELLQDPSMYAELPPSPKLGALPSAEGSTVGVAEENTENNHPESNLRSLPSPHASRPSTPREERDSTPVVETTQADTHEESKTATDIAKGVGFAGIVDAAVSAAVKGDDNTPGRGVIDESGHAEFTGNIPESDNTVTQEVEPIRLERRLPEDSEAEPQSTDPPEAARPFSPSRDKTSADSAGVSEAAITAEANSKGDKGADLADTTQPEHAAELKGVPSDVADQKKDLNELSAAEKAPPAEAADKSLGQPQEKPVEEPAVESASASSSKKKKKNKKKGQSVDLAEPESTPAIDLPASEHNGKPEELSIEQEPTAMAAEIEQQPSSEFEASKSLEPEPVQPGEAQPEEAPPADVGEPPAPAVSSKKAKRDKKKGKSKVPESEERPEEPSGVEAPQPTAEAGTEHDGTQSTAEPENAAVEAPESGENVRTQIEESAAHARDEPVEPTEEVTGTSEELAQPTGQDRTAPTEETRELDGQLPVSGTDQEPGQVEAQEGAQETDGAKSPVEWQEPLEYPSADPRELPGESGETTISDAPKKDIAEVSAESETLVPESERTQFDVNQETVQETPAPAEESAPTEVVPESPAPDQGPPAAENEPEPAISRKASKKNKKKNKRKNTPDAPVESEVAEVKEPPSGEEKPDGQSERGIMSEAPLESEQPQVQHDQAEQPIQDLPKQDDPALETAPGEQQPDSTPADTTRDVTSEPQETGAMEEWEDQPKKKGKKGKKNRKSTSLSEAQPEPEPEPKPEQLEFVDAPEIQPPHASDEVPIVGENESTPEAKNDEAAATEGAVTTEAEEKEPTPLEEQPEIKNNEVATPEGVEPAATETEKEPISLEKHSETNDDTTSMQPSTAEGISAYTEAKEVPVENEAPKDTTAEVLESQTPAPVDIPLTPAQKKKAKKDKKKKRQSASVEETPVSEPAGESAQNEAVSEGDAALTEQPAVVQEPEDTQTSMGEASVMDPAKNAEEAPKEEPTRDGSTDAQTDTNATPEAPQDSSLDSAGPAVGPAPDIEESKIEETPAREEAENKVTKEGEETGSSAAIGLYSEQEPKYDSSPAGDLTSMDGTQAIASEPEPQTEETTTAGATTEGLAPDDRATAEDSQEPIEGAGTVAADGASQEQDQSQAEEAQTMTSKKSKKDKKKKKKRQSQTFEDEPTEKTAVSGEAETVEPSSEKAVSAEAEKSEDVPPQETAPEAAPVESADPAPTEEVQSTTSKKAKKDKKKRKSVSFDIEEPAAEPSDPNESKEGASEATPPADEAKPDDTATQGELVVSNVGGISSQEPEESQQSIDSRKEVPSVATGEHGEDNQPAEFASLADKVTGLDYEPTLEATETPATVPSESEIQSPSGEEKADDNAPVESEKTEATGAVQEADIVKGVEADSGGEPVASEDLSTADPQSANPDDGEQVPDFPKSKKDKKKKKKRNTSDLNEEAPTVITESPGATPEEAFRSTELEPANIQEPQETGQQPETQEVKEAARQPEKQEEEDKPLMSAKEKRKAKKDKKRKSKLSETDSDGQNGTASTPETPVLEESKDLSAPVNSAATENASQEAPATETGALDSSPATVVPPAEDDGKHNQSHDTQTSDEKEKDRIWTDETMSSQVEQQQTTSSDYPPQPAPEHTASDPISVPSGNDPDYSAPNTANEEGLSTSRSEPEASFEDKLLSDISETANEKSADLKQGEEAGNMDSKPEQIEEIPERDNIPSEPKEETTEQPATEESRAKESGSPAIPSAGTEEAFEDNSKLETPPAPEEEDWGMTASSKKKKKKKQKQREEQLRRNQLDAPENKEQEKGDFPVIEKPTTTPEYSSSEPGQMRVETALEPAETEAPKEPVTASEEPTLESGQKDDEPATEVAAEPQAPKELSEPSEDVTTNAEDVEMPGLPRKLTKKEKKKKRRSLAEEATSNTPEGDTSASTVPDNATAPAPSDSHEQNPAVDSDTNKHTLPEEQESGVKEAAEAETVREAPTSPAIDEQNKPELGVSHTRDVGNIQEEPTAAGDAIDPKQSPVEVAEEPRQPELDTNEATREVLEEPEDSWSTTSKKKNKKNKKKARTQEASAGEPAQVEEATATIEPTVEAPEAGEKSSREMPSNENVPEQPSEEKKDNVEDDSWTMPLTKKGKKAKKEKQARALEAEVPGFVETQEGANVDDGTAIANEHTNAPPVETLAMASEEQTREVEQTQQGPSISLDPFDVPLEPEALDVDKTTESADMHKLIEPGPESEPDPEGKEGAQKKLQLEALEKKDDLEAAQGLFQDSLKEPEVEAPLSRKLSKKDKRKSKQKALQSAIESTEQPEPEAPKEPEGSREITEDPMMSVVEQQDDAPLSRASSKKKKKKAKKDSQLMEREQPEEPEQEAGEPRPVTLAEHPEDVPADKFRRQQPQQDEEAWPTIDWGNDKGVNPVEEPPQPSSVSQQDPLGPGMESIGEFDESAIPWAVGKESEEPPAEDTWFTASKKKDKKKKKSQQKGVDLPSPTPADGMKDKSIEGSVLQSGKDNAEEETIDQGANRDNAMQVSEAPIATIEDNNYEAGSWPAPDNRSPRGNQSTSTAPTAPDPLQPTTREIDVSSATGPSHNVPVFPEGPGNENTSATVQLKDNDNDSTPSTHPASDPRTPSDSTCRLRRSQSIHGKHNHPPRPWSLDETTETTVETARATSAPQSLFGGPVGANADAISPPRTPLGTIAEQEPENHVGKTGGTMAPRSGTGQLEVKPEHLLPHPQTPVRKFTDNALDRQKWPTPDKDRGMEMGMEDESDELQKRRTDSPSVTPSERGLPPGPILTPSSHEKRALRRTTSRVSGDLRATSRAQEISETEDSQPLPPPARTPPPPDLNIEHIASSSSYDPVTDKGKRPLRGMTDVYEGWGQTPTSPRSPSRPPSVRHRRSMQHLQDLETRLDQLISENRLLVAEKEAAEGRLKNASVARRKSDHALNTRDADLRDKEAEVEQLRSSVDWLQKEVGRLTEENQGLTTTNSGMAAAHAQELLAVRQSSTRDFDDLQSQHQQLSAGIEDRVRQEVETALSQKNAEIRRLHEELEATREKVRDLQQQIAASMQDDVLVFRDEDYFDGACQKLCGHVQQWVLRFSKHSDHHRCRKLADLHDEKIADRFDNSILDGSDADAYLSDRVRRRDVFMSVVMTMIWEYIFTRYLFGMDRDQRQKLKSLEKHLVEVGPRNAVHRWRATTLTLLAKRDAFARQRESDTEAVALEIFGTLSRLLPPPTHAEGPLLESLRKVLRVAVSLSIEMRTQLAEYIMLPPLQPEYDTNGDLARHVYFNASLMNERSGETTSNEELETQQSVVRIVLFPLVVKKGNDAGEGEDEVVVCPAQVLIARPFKDKSMLSLNTNRSVHSIAPSATMDMGNMI